MPIFDTLLCSTKDETGKSVPAFPITQYKRAGGLTLLKVATQSAIVVNATKFYSIYSPNTFQTGTSVRETSVRWCHVMRVCVRVCVLVGGRVEP